MHFRRSLQRGVSLGILGAKREKNQIPFSDSFFFKKKNFLENVGKDVGGGTMRGGLATIWGETKIVKSDGNFWMAPPSPFVSHAPMAAGAAGHNLSIS